MEHYKCILSDKKKILQHVVVEGASFALLVTCDIAVTWAAVLVLSC
jgi:hypothetical protein